MEQVRVNSLTHMVVVVDESSGDSATAALESKLQVRSHVWFIFIERQIPKGLFQSLLTYVSCFQWEMGVGLNT